MKSDVIALPGRPAHTLKPSFLGGLAERVLRARLAHLRHGELILEDAAGIERFGRPSERMPLSVRLRVHDRRFWTEATFGGSIGAGESYLLGDWSCDDLTGLMRILLANRDVLDGMDSGFARLTAPLQKVLHAASRNTRDGSRRNIAAHYDLGNDFFSLFLDRDLMMYSSAWYETADDSLETAQRQKLDRICRKLQLTPNDHVLEIGTGWGGFAAYAAQHYGCRVTTTTISKEQHALAAERFSRLGAAGERITLLMDDYRHLQGRFDKIVSIEMFEAVGLAHYDTFFATCDRLLAPDGAALLQLITMNEQDFPTYCKSTDWMQTYVFPGSELASLSELLKSLGRVTTFRPFHLEDMGTHYARTLHDWRERFMQRLDDVRALGMDDRFLRTWNLYLAFCEAAFAERHISVVQLMLTRGYHDRRYFTDTGAVATPASAAVTGLRSTTSRH